MSQDFEVLMSKLTPREQQICKVIQQQPSLNYTGIGQRVGISKHTVNFHLKSVYTKLSVDGKTALAVKLSKGGDSNG